MTNGRKIKIINDPVFGFINIPTELVYDVLKHPYVQRLGRIRQLGVSFFVYPGAEHTRLLHSLGAMHLVQEALIQLRLKGNEIKDAEFEGTLCAMLMHDIGHGPFSHVLENVMIEGVRHEEISLLMMRRMNEEMNGALDTAIRIFTDEYPKKFLHQLVSGQLDADRLDYLRRDSYFTGVTEGNIGSARIIKMLNVQNDKLVVEDKGIYSIENFLTARRLMYWQVYLHKTSVAAEKMLINTFKRAKILFSEGKNLFASPAFRYFLCGNINEKNFFANEEAVENYFKLDDNDVLCALKVWADEGDKVLSLLSKGLVNRVLFKIKVGRTPFPEKEIEEKIYFFSQELQISTEEASYLVSAGKMSTNMYSEKDDSIDILYKNGTITDLSKASDMLNIELLSKKVTKYYFCFLRY